jgi:hypothetical protein
MWALSFPLPLAYVVRPLDNGPFRLVLMHHKISFDANQRTVFPPLKYRDRRTLVCATRLFRNVVP